MHEGDTRETRGRYQGHIRDWETHASGIIIITIHKCQTVYCSQYLSLLAAHYREFYTSLPRRRRTGEMTTLSGSIQPPALELQRHAYRTSL